MSDSRDARRAGDVGRGSSPRDGAGRPGGSRGRGAGQRRTSAGRGGAAPSGAARGGPAAEPKVADGPAIPDDITGKELDPATLKQLSGLGGKATPVARHLVAAWRLLDDEPELAVEHALAASARGARLATVREAAGEALYAAGRYDKAASELRAAKRLSGSLEMLPLIADCERGLGRPERALALAADDEASRLTGAAAVEMRIVAAGARGDLGQIEAALLELEIPLLFADEVSEPAARLRYAYADLLERVQRRSEARDWFGRSARADTQGLTDAQDRLDAIEAP